MQLDLTKSKLSVVVIAASLSVTLSANDRVELSEVMVSSAAGFEQKIEDAPASISVITQEDLQRKPYTNLLDAVRDIEGVDIGETRDKSGQGGVSMRGMGADYTLILIDGKKQNNHGDIFPNAFGGFQYANMPPLSMIERIEVVRGPMSTLYGSEAMGGVINIITKKVSNEWVGSFTQSQTFQSDSRFGNDRTSDFALMGPLINDTLGLSLRGSYYDKKASNPGGSSGFGGAGKTMDNQNWTLGAGLTYIPNDQHTIRFDYDVAKQKYDNSDSDVGTVDSYQTIFNNQRVGYSEIQRMQRTQWSLLHEALWDIGKSSVGVHYIKTENLGRSLPLSASDRAYIIDNKVSGTWANLDDAMDDPYFRALMPRPTRTLESNQYTYDAKLEMPLGYHFVVVGAEYIDGKLKDDVFGMEDGNAGGKTQDHSQWSIFAEDNYMVSESFTVTGGARYDKHKVFGSNVSPRLYGVYQLNPEWTIKGGVATGYKTPKTTDLYDGIIGFGSQGTSPWLGNPDLKPEKSLSKEIALYYSHFQGHNFNVTIFQNDFKDKIERGDATTDFGLEWQNLGYTNYRQSQNVGKAEIKGLEFAGRYQLIDSFAIRGNYTHTDSQRKDTKDPLGSSAKHLYNLTLDWDMNARLNTQLKMSGEKDRWRGRSDARPSSLNYYDDFMVFDLGTSYRVNDSVTFNTKINNLLDKDFTKRTSYIDTDGDVREVDNYNLAQKRREFWLSMTVNF